jgi:mRNA interferase MazF
VYLVSFDPALGAEIQKTRPALILQNDIGNLRSPVTIVAALTSNVLRRGPTSVLVNAPEGGLTVDSVILLNQIRTIDRRRLAKHLGVLRAATVKQVDQAIQISLGLIEI